MSSPRVSIGLPVRNGEATLPLALVSILAQTYSDWELIVIDDGSTDRSFEIARAAVRDDSRVRVIRDGRSLGLAARLNELVRNARGELFARMDADDVAYPHRLAQQVAFLSENPAVDLVGSAMVVFKSGGQARGVRRGPLSHDDICAQPERGFRLFHPTWLGRTDWFRQHSYCPTATRCEDQELLYRTHDSSRFANIAEPLMGYREDCIPLKKTLSSRRYFVRHVCSSLLRKGRPVTATSVIAQQVAKGLAESTAAALGLEAMLHHRAAPATEAELTQWRSVWQDLVERPACVITHRHGAARDAHRPLIPPARTDADR